MQEANIVDITPFLAKHQLPLKYQYLSEQFFIPLAEDILAAKPADSPMLVAVNGCQGSGKTTLADFLVTWLNTNTSYHCIAMSIDDFYLSRSKRQQLAKDVHPLFATRGVPGTHDTQLMYTTLNQLLGGETKVPLPAFDKQTDDPVPREHWHKNEQPVDIIIFEGWCVASASQQPYQLQAPINNLELQEDQEGVWRRCVNSCLANEYQQVFSLIDYTVMLKAPSFADVYAWRLEQEQKLIAKKGVGKGTFNESQLLRFISHFERITRENLATLADKADAVLNLDSQRDIVSMHLLADDIEQPIIFTDLDGTLLDHHNYQCDVVKPLLAQLSQAGTQVIFNTSKTFAEVTHVQQFLAHNQPFIVENGAAVYLPKYFFPLKPIGCDEYQGYWRYSFAPLNDVLHQDLADHAKDFAGHYQLFSQMSVSQVQRLTGLDEQQSILALTRQYSDPIHFTGDDDELQGFVSCLHALGYDVLIGGRFLHATKGNNKGRAQQWLVKQFEKHQKNPFTVIALGDSHNDIAMLEAADIAILILNPGSKVQHEIQHKAWQISDLPAPHGWIKEVSALSVIKARLAIQQEQNHG